MSLTSYRAAPPRAIVFEFGFGPLWSGRVCVEKIVLSCVLQTWQRPTLPRLKTKYHRRWGVSRPCSEWERVQPPRQNHQVGKAQDLLPAGANFNREAGEVFDFFCFEHVFWRFVHLPGAFCSARPKAVAPFSAARPDRFCASGQKIASSNFV